MPLTLAPATAFALPAVVALPALVAYVAFATVPDTLAPWMFDKLLPAP